MVVLPSGTVVDTADPHAASRLAEAEPELHRGTPAPAAADAWQPRVGSAPSSGCSR